jgi:trans-aconitate 2-methyltransferase
VRGHDVLVTDAWNPSTYHRFAAERRQPFDDLLGLVTPVPGGRVIDLGCGSGELTVELHRHTKAAETVGVDTSPAMLAEASRHTTDHLRFVRSDLSRFPDETGGEFDVVFSNAALHWVPDHSQLLGRLAAGLAPGGQLAFQVPANFDHPSHLAARHVAETEPFAARLAAAGVGARPEPVLPPERYAELLDEDGFTDQHVRLQVYGHHLASTDDVVDWVRGTLLTPYQAAFSDDDFAGFLDAYRVELRRRLGERRPYFYPFKRILAWARRPG